MLHLAGAAALLVIGASATAGPPYVTDDPEPTDTGHWEIYNFISGSGYDGVTQGQGGFDINYGAAEDIQLTAVIPANYSLGSGLPVGLGDVQLAFKWKFLHQNGAGVDVAFFPRLFVPVGRDAYSNGHVGLLLPLWAEIDSGSWSVFGGGGYDLNPGMGQKDYWLSGIGVQRSFGERFTLGAELYGQTATQANASSYAGLNLGMTYKVSDHWTFLTAAGPALKNADAGGSFNFYAAFLLSF